jgi:copper chaperone CopZ
MANIYRVEGMSCGKCAASVERVIKAALPAAQVTVDLEAKTVQVSGLADEAKLKSLIEGAGFDFLGAA